MNHPAADGDSRVYSPDRNFRFGEKTIGELISEGEGLYNYTATGKWIGRCRVVYVNGINTGLADHSATVTLLATLIGRDVTGLYNATDGFFGDFRQCLQDIAIPVGRMRPFTQFGRGLMAAERILPQNQQVTLYRRLLKMQNRAAGGLFEMLVDEAVNASRPIVLVCHSQGNLIANNAVWALSRVRPASMPNVFCLSLASPAASWPERGGRYGFHLELFQDPRDGVTLASARGIGQPARTMMTPGSEPKQQPSDCSIR